ncbi:MAG: ABC transporter substrate-binding protein [Candidatus Aerophobetes bacterium]|nr:ABC transporter substrate-binding protein [Candidatus Aerophobetes bacterium]
MSRSKVVLVTVLVGVGLLFSLSGASAKPGVKKIKVGVVYPLSGAIADTGARCKAAIEAALDLINNSHPEIDLPIAASEGIPSLNGAKLEAIFADHEASPEIGKSETERLITREDVKAAIGCYNSAVTKPASFVAERYGIPFISGCSSSAALTERGLKYFFRLAVTDQMDTKAFLDDLDELREEKGYSIKTIGVLYENTEFGQHAAMSVKEANKQRDYQYKVVADVSYPFGAINVDSAVMKLKEADPDVVIAASLLSDYILFVKTFKDYGWVPKGMISFCGGFQDPKSLERLGKDAWYFSGSSILPPELIKKIPVLNKVNELYKKHSPGGVGLDGVMLEIFEAPIVLADALNRAGTIDSEALTKAIRETDIKTELNVGGGIKFNEKGQNVLAKSATVQVQEGKYVTVLPLKVATADIVWPIPAWLER